jgi:hypothetical protein
VEHQEYRRCGVLGKFYVAEFSPAHAEHHGAVSAKEFIESAAIPRAVPFQKRRIPYLSRIAVHPLHRCTFENRV